MYMYANTYTISWILFQ